MPQKVVQRGLRQGAAEREVLEEDLRFRFRGDERRLFLLRRAPCCFLDCCLDEVVDLREGFVWFSRRCSSDEDLGWRGGDVQEVLLDLGLY